MIEILLILLLLLLTAVFGVVLGVHLQAAKSKTDCGCGRRRDALTLRVQRLEMAQRASNAADVPVQHGAG